MKVYRLATIIGLGIILAWSLSSCKLKKAAEEVKKELTIQSVSFSPSPPLENQDLTANIIFFASNNQGNVTFTYKWYRDGDLVQEGPANVLPGSEVRLGSEIYVSVQGRLAAMDSKWVQSEKVIPIKQEIKFTTFGIVPTNPYKVDTLGAKYECENCEGMRFYFRWYLNGQLLRDQTERNWMAPRRGLTSGTAFMWRFLLI